jgi:hypothetical protein
MPITTPKEGNNMNFGGFIILAIGICGLSIPFIIYNSLKKKKYILGSGLIDHSQ